MWFDDACSVDEEQFMNPQQTIAFEDIMNTHEEMGIQNY